MITNNLFWLILALPATFFFAYASSAGLLLILSALKSLPRIKLMHAFVIVSFLLGTYAVGFVPAKDYAPLSWVDLKPLQSLLLSNLGVFNGDHQSIRTTSDAADLNNNWFRLPLPYVVTKTVGLSHAICVIIGLFVVQWLSSFIQRLKDRGIDEYQYSWVDSFLAVSFHLKFFLGTFLWYRYFLMPVSSSLKGLATGTPGGQDVSTNLPLNITTFAASILGVSHTLAFSIGFHIYRDYCNRGLSKLSESQITWHYLTYAGALVVGRLAFQAVCDATGLDPTSHDILMLSSAITSFILLTNRSNPLMLYFWLPLAAGLISIIPALDHHPVILALLPYVSHNREYLTLTIIGVAGFAVGAKWAVQPVLAALATETTTTTAATSAGGLGSKTRMQTMALKMRAASFPPPFPNGWYSLAASKDVKSSEVIHVQALGRDFAVFRGNDGQAGVLDALCPHLGANIAIGSKVVGNTVECPFHGWKFNKAGKCTDIPYAANVPESVKTKSWPIREMSGVIMIWFDAEERDPFYEPRKFPLEGKSHYQVTERVATLPMHIQDFAENASDWMHFGQVHSRLSLPILDRFLYVKHRTRWSPSPPDGDEGPLSNDAANDDPPVPKSLTSKHMLPTTQGPDLHKYPDTFHFSFYDVPSLYSIFSAPGAAAIPSGDVRARVEFTGQGGLVYFRFHTPSGEVMVVKTFLPVGNSDVGGMMLQMKDVVYAESSVPWLFAKHIASEAAHAFDDDIFLWTNKTYFKRPLLIKEDRPVKKFREWYSQHYSPNSRTFAFETNEW